MKPLIITAAVNGGWQRSQGVTKVPLSPLEIAEEAVRCREAGASILHFHSRDADGQASSDPDLYRETIRLVRERCDILIQTTNGIGARKDKVTGEWSWPSDAERIALLNIEPRPDLYGAATGSVDFVHPYGGSFVETVFINNLDWMKTCIKHAHDQGSAIEFEIVHLPALCRLKALADDGLFDANADYLWLLFGGGIAHHPTDPQLLIPCIDAGRRLFPNAKICMLGGGPTQFRVAAIGLTVDCDIVRVGFEDNIFRPNGDPAESTAQLVADAVGLAGYFGRRPATPDETRKTFRLGRNVAEGQLPRTFAIA